MIREGLSKRVISELNIRRNHIHEDLGEKQCHAEGTASTKVLWPEQQQAGRTKRTEQLECKKQERGEYWMKLKKKFRPDHLEP